MGLVEERERLRKHFEAGNKPSNVVLADYRLNRNSEYWRSSRLVEEMCEYILFLERQAGVEPEIKKPIR